MVSSPRKDELLLEARFSTHISSFNHILKLFSILTNLLLFTLFNVLFLYTTICTAGINPVLELIPADDFTMLKSLEGKWAGTLERTNGSSDSFNVEYSITSNGSALMEESFTGGIEMLTIFNLQNDELLLTHYCGLKNRPVSRLKSSKDGVFRVCKLQKKL